MKAPQWTRRLLGLLAPSSRERDIVGDLEEAHRRRLDHRGPRLARLLTGVEAIDMAAVLLRQRVGGWVGVSLLDFKLGWRMLIRYPGLTVVGGLAMAFAIWVGAVTFEVVNQFLTPDLPLDEGDRIVGIQNWDTEANRSAAPFLEDFVTWRDEVRTIGELGAFREVSRNLVLGEEVPEPVAVAEISASGFQVARVRPLLGRTLMAADEAVDAPAVVVIGYDLWQTRFQGDPEVLGRTVGIGSAPSTVVGVMPEGFAFPRAHAVWVPLRWNMRDLEPGGGRQVAVFGRLAPGGTRSSAQAELDLLSARRATRFPDTLGRIRPRVLSYVRSVQPLPDIGSGGLMAANMFMLMLLLLICGNIALLMFARAATREGEIVVRSALGASRARIVSQLFSEALVLGGVAAAVGLAAAGFGVKWYVSMAAVDSGGQAPFWIRDHLAPATILYLCGLALIASVIVGVGPALKATGRQVGSGLRQTSVRVGGIRIGGVWTAVLVSQVAVTVAFPTTAFVFHRYVAHVRSLDLGFEAGEYLSARLEADEVSFLGNERALDVTPPGVRLASLYQELEQSLTGESEVLGMTFASRLPGMNHPRSPIEVDEAGPLSEADPQLFRAASALIDVDFFRVLDAPIAAGRVFDSGDLNSDVAVVIVNRAFVDEVLGSRNPIGRRVRYAVPADEESRRWHEIVGVAENLGIVGGPGFFPRNEPALYLPATLDDIDLAYVAIHLRGDPEAFTNRLRILASSVDRSLRLHDLRALNHVAESQWNESQFLFRLLTGVSIVALILSLTGIYSVMSFTVTRRTREIGVRVALGSDRRRIVVSIFRRPIMQVLAGIAVGAWLVFLLVLAVTGPLGAREIGLVGLYATLMFVVCMLACIVPTRRALGVEPAEALRADW